MAVPAPCDEGMQRTLEETKEALQLLEQARALESRARAVEWRALAILEEAEETAAVRLKEAQQQAHHLLSRAGEGAVALETEARQAGQAAGHEEGLRAGLQEGEARAEALLAEARQQAEQARQEALEERSLLLDASGEQLLDLAFAMARQVLKAELALRPAALVPMLEAALAKLKGEEEPLLRVSPEVLSLLEEHRGRLLAAIPGARKLEVEGDPSLGEGDFILQGAQGFVDGRVERQVQVLEEKVRTEEQ
jgi:flagellar assembly protein FliH